MENREIIIGKKKGHFFNSTEVLTEAELNHHVHVVGASGFGKTVLLSHIVKNRIETGKGLLFIDLKCDVETINKFKGFAKNAGRLNDLMIFNLTEPSHSAYYNLIADGSATQLRDKIMLSLTWSEEFYKNQSGSFLLKALIGLCYLRDNQNLSINIGDVLKAASDVDRVAELSALVPESQTKVKVALEDCYNFLNQSENYKSLQGLRSQLESLVLSDFGECLTRDSGSNSLGSINLFTGAMESKIVIILLDSRRYGESAKTVGRFILQDLKMTSARIDAEVRKENRKPFAVVIDEFADLASEDFIGFLDRARSSRMPVVTSHQELSDLQRISPEFAGRLMGNTSTLYAFLQKRPESAETIAGIAGTRSAWKTTKQTEKFWLFDVETGGGSKREVEEFVIHPNLIKSLSVGKCICIKKYPESRAYLVDVDPSA